MKFTTRCICFSFALLMLMFSACCFAEGTVNGTEQKYYLGTRPGDLVNAGKDTGYSETNEIDKDDPHYGWSLGHFYIKGYTSQTTDANGNPVFLKNVGDKVELWFQLDQDISCLNGDSELIICEDKNGYDKYFGVSQTNFGRGTVIIRHTDYQNKPGEPVIYTDYLAALTVGAPVQVELFEEGDYEVALNYEIKDVGISVLGSDYLSGYDNYRIFFRFSVRNGNCMVYPFDTATGDELTNSATTENGFYLDLARSRYLDIVIKKSVMNETSNGLVEDTRFNKPAQDGEKYTEEGVYTITVKNKYTGAETVKTIYVGTDDVLEVHANTGRDVNEIRKMVETGEWYIEDGTLVASADEAVTDSEPVEEVAVGSEEAPAAEEKTQPASADSGKKGGVSVGLTVVIALVSGAVGFIIGRKTVKKES